MPIIIGGVTLTKIMIDSIECKKAIIGATTVFEVVSNYTVNFIANGSIVSTKTVAAGGTTTLPSNPSRSNWTFVKWVYGVSNTQFTTSTTVNSNINVYAYWYQYAVVDQETCYKCSGSGYAYNDVSCPDCYGLGYREDMGPCGSCGGVGCDVCNWSGFAECMTCSGTGYANEYGVCDVCEGSGVLDVYDDVYEAY